MQETFIFKRGVSLTIRDSGIGFAHDYGEDIIPWDTVTHTFAVLLKKQKHPFPIIFLMKKMDTGTFYYLDSNTVSHKHFRIHWALKDHANPLQAKKSPEEEFKNLIKELCSRCTAAYIDKPLIAFVRGGAPFLPSFSALRSVYDYCLRIVDTVSGKQQETPLLVQEEVELPKVAAPTKQREEWGAGKVFDGQYTVQEVLRGGMGTVYIVFDPEIVQFFAVKTFQERYLWDERVIKQFIKEAEIWIKLERHPNIVQAILVKVIEGKPYIFLEYVQGTDLEQLMNSEKLDIRSILEYGIQFCEGITYAVRKLGLIHRDIKPSNCLITREGTLKITDFGLGKIFDKSPMDGELVSIPQKTRKGKTSTSSTTMVGTLPFMAPELFSNLKAAGMKTDIYSFGVLLYMMITGENPFFSEEASDVITNHLMLTPEDPGKLNKGVPAALSRVVMKCLEKDPAQRYDDFAEIQAELEIIYIEAFGSPYEKLEKENVLIEEDWINKGLSLASIYCHREAIITFDQALKINPHSIKALIYKGVSLMNFGKILESLTCFDACLKIDKYIWEPWFYKGEAHWKLGNNDEALRCFDRALEFADENAPIMGRKGKLLQDAGKYKAAQECYEQALSQNPRSAEIWYEKGNLFIIMKQFEEALKALKNSLEINPRFTQALCLQGIALYNLGHFSEALNSQKKATTIDPEFAEPWVCIGDCRREQGNIQDALNAYQAAIKIQPDNIGAYRKSILLLKENSRWDDGIQLIDKALEIEPENPGLLLERAEVLLNLGHYEESYSMCQLVQEMEPENVDILPVISSVTKMLQEQEALFAKISSVVVSSEEYSLSDLNGVLSFFCSVEDALSYAEKREDCSPGEIYLKASLYFISGKYGECINLLEAGMLDPENHSKAKSLAEMAEERIEAEKAAAAKKKSIVGTIFKKGERDEESAEELMIIGLEKLRYNMNIDSISYFKEALAIDPSLHACRFFTGRAYGQEGMMEKSLQSYQDFKSHVPFSKGFWKEMLSTFSMSDPREVEAIYCNWIGSNPEDYHPWLAYLTFLSDKKYYTRLQLVASGLLKNYNKSWKLKENSSLFFNIKAILQYLLQRYSEAQKSFAKSREQDSNNAAALMGIGLCYDAREIYDNAGKFFGKLLERDETSETGSYLLANSYLKQQAYDDALSVVENSIRKTRKSLPLMKKRAQILFLAKKHAEFSHYYSQIYTLDPHLISLKILRSLTLLETQGTDAAIVELTNILTYDLYNLTVLKNLGFLYIQTQNLQKALTTFDTMLSIYQLDHEVHLGKGITCYLMLDFDRARACFCQALQLDPLNADLWQFMGAVNYHLGKYKESGNCWDKAIHYRSRFVQAWTNKSIFLYLQKEYQRAQECVDRTLRMEPANSPAWLCRAQCLWKLGNSDEATLCVEKAISFTPQSIKAWVLQGIIAFYNNNYEISKQCFEKATEIENKNPELWYNRGLLCLYLKAQPDSKLSTEQARALNQETKKSLDRALALRPDFPEGLIARFVYEKFFGGASPGHVYLSRAQNLDLERFNEWADEYQETRDPLIPLKPIELSEELFNLPFERPLSQIEPLETMHYFNTLEKM